MEVLVVSRVIIFRCCDIVIVVKSICLPSDFITWQCNVDYTTETTRRIRRIRRIRIRIVSHSLFEYFFSVEMIKDQREYTN